MYYLSDSDCEENGVCGEPTNLGMEQMLKDDLSDGDSGDGDKGGGPYVVVFDVFSDPA